MNILSLDISTKSTGFGFFKNCKLGKFHGSIKTSDGFEDMYEKVRNLIKNLHEKYGVNTIVVEDVYYSRNQKVFKTLAFLQGMIFGFCKELGITVEFMLPASWRKILGLNKKGAKRDELKKRAIEYVKDTLGIEVKDDDEADGICIGLAFIKKNKLG